jgi:hypothetical protein
MRQLRIEQDGVTTLGGDRELRVAILHELAFPPAPNGCLNEAPWLAHGGHGALLRQPLGSPITLLARKHRLGLRACHQLIKALAAMRGLGSLVAHFREHRLTAYHAGVRQVPAPRHTCNGSLLGCGGCQHRRQSLVNCDHGGSMASHCERYPLRVTRTDAGEDNGDYP